MIDVVLLLTFIFVAVAVLSLALESWAERRDARYVERMRKP